MRCDPNDGGAVDATPTTFEVRHSVLDGVTWLRLAGEIDTFNAGALEQQVFAVVDQSERVVVDLAALEFIDGGGVRALGRIHEVARSRGQQLSIENGNRLVRRLFQILKLDDVFGGRDDEHAGADA